MEEFKTMLNSFFNPPNKFFTLAFLYAKAPNCQIKSFKFLILYPNIIIINSPLENSNRGSLFYGKEVN